MHSILQLFAIWEVEGPAFKGLNTSNMLQLMTPSLGQNIQYTKPYVQNEMLS